MHQVCTEQDKSQQEEHQTEIPRIVSSSDTSSSLVSRSPVLKETSSSEINHHYSPSSSSFPENTPSPLILTSTRTKPTSTEATSIKETTSEATDFITCPLTSSSSSTYFEKDIKFPEKNNNCRQILAEPISKVNHVVVFNSSDSVVTPIEVVGRGETSSCSSSIASLESPNRQPFPSQSSKSTSPGHHLQSHHRVRHPCPRLHQPERLQSNNCFAPPVFYPHVSQGSTLHSPSPSSQLDYCQVRNNNHSGVSLPFAYDFQGTMSTNSGVFYGSLPSTGSACSTSSTTTSTSVNMTPTSTIPPLNPPRFGTTIPNRIFVGGITTDTSECDLEALFARFGNVNAVKIINDRAGVPRGYGFVTFDSEDEAKRVLREGDNLVLKGRKLNVAIAVKKAPIGRVDLMPFYGGLETLGHLPYHQHSHHPFASNALLFQGSPSSGLNGSLMSHQTSIPGCPALHSPMTPFSPLFQDPYAAFPLGMDSQASTAALMAAIYGIPSAGFSPTMPLPASHHPNPESSSVTNGPTSGHHHQHTGHHHPSSQGAHQSSQYLFYPNSAAGGGHQNSLPGHFAFMSNASGNPTSHHHHPQSVHSSQMPSHLPVTSSSSQPTASTSPSSTTWTPHPPYIMPPVLVNNHHMSHVS